MRIAIVTDAWYPQPNGVVRVLGTIKNRVEAAGHDVLIVSPDQFRTIPCPSYSEIRLALAPSGKVSSLLDAFAPHAIHIATEGPLGWAARFYCLARSRPFTTAYHTKFPQYLHARTRLPLSWLYGAMRRFHAPARHVLVPSSSVARELTEVGFANLRPWSHGVDIDLFRPRGKGALDFPRPIFMYVGRVTVDKNLPAFLNLNLPGTKVVVGSGPSRSSLMRRYPDARFLIANGDEELARFYSAADAFVFPSRTDTFGLVMLEAMAAGVPVAAFPVTGPLDVIGDSSAGVLAEDLRAAALKALSIPSDLCRAHAARFSWDRVADEFLAALAV